MFEDSQAQIIDHLYGGLLVLAPVGTGKTYALTERAARALEAGFAPERVLCLTFTNRAAQEVANRLAARFGEKSHRVTVKTFHGLCARILRIEAKSAGLAADFTVCDDADSVAMLRELGSLDHKTAQDLYWEFSRQKAAVVARDLQWPPDLTGLFESFVGVRTIVEGYQRELALQHTLDFGDLVLFVGSLFARRPEVRQRWAERYEFVQVDELQDTHRSEYRIVWVLAKRSGNLALFGDVDQTIYEWRGSDPDAIIERFREDFAPVTELSLTLNRRAARRLVNLASSFAESFDNRRTTNLPADDSPEGELVPVHRAADGGAEAEWIGRQIQALAAEQQDFAYRSVGVLTGTNRHGAAISRVLESLGVPHVTVEQFDFFRRQEVKDALAFLRLILNPSNTSAMIRVVERSVSGVGSGTMNRIQKAGEPVGLRRIDLLRSETFATGDPFGRLIDEYQHGSLTVVDVETTGLSALHDEIVEIAAVRLERGVVTDQKLEMFVRTATPVGESLAIHGLTDEILAEQGQPPAEALQRFFEFCQSDLLVGHNVGFDLRMLAAQARRLDLEVPDFEFIDTLDCARRFLECDDFSLVGLAERLGLPHRPAHRAMEDAVATCDLLAVLAPRLARYAEERRQLVTRESPPFALLAQDLEDWRILARDLRPGQLLRRVLEESGLTRHYATEPRRLEHLDELLAIFDARDDPGLDPLTALNEIVNYTALARNVDHLRDNDNRVPIITIHQSKGLEFETVFVAGLFEGELPRYWSVQEGRIEEERRLFYVALTRARRRLYLSLCASNDDRPKDPSQFLDCLDQSLLQRV